MIGKIDHVGYLVKNINKASASFGEFGFAAVSDITRDEYRGVDICFMEKDGYVIELVCPYTRESIVAGIVKTHRNSPYHICYRVKDISDAKARLEEAGFISMDEPAPAPAMENKPVCFLMSARMGMIELVENKED